MKIGIVGCAADKFTAETEHKAKRIIRQLLSPGDILVSGGCHLGGIDIWAEDIADEMGIEKEIFLPAHRRWEGGYKQRNLSIARASDIVHCIVVAEYPAGYAGMRFSSCYHCHTQNHIKSGGCWTAHRASVSQWHIIRSDKENEMKVINVSGLAFEENGHRYIKHKDIVNNTVYVGRPSAFGNPFRIGADGSRAEVIRRYKRWFWDKINSDAKFLAAVLDLKDRDLACFCAPDPCHADVIKAWFDAGCPLKEV